MDDDKNITLDTFFQDEKISHLFLKMDIEGYERKALDRAINIMKHEEDICGYVYIYHLYDDKEVISTKLKGANLQTSIQPGCLYFGGEIRPAIIRF